MEKLQFKQILFKTAFCCMACDGHIDDREIKELKVMDKNTTYFEDVDLSKELEHLISQFGSKGKKTVEELFQQLRDTDLNTVQELLLLEVALRIINADERIDDNEVKFIHFLRSKLKVHDETILDRFGNVEFLFDRDYKNEITAGNLKQNLMDSIVLPEMADLKSVDLSESNA